MKEILKKKKKKKKNLRENKKDVVTYKQLGAKCTDNLNCIF
jgi:hypothetical protein